MADLGLSGFVFPQFQPSGNTQHIGRGRGKSNPIAVSQRELEAYEINNAQAGPEYWETGFRARFPWVGFGALLLMLGCMGTTIAILKTSDNKAKEQWPVKESWHFVKDSWQKRTQITPSVALAVVNTISNVCLAVAIGQGVAIAWWRKALKGSTVEDLHKTWGFSASVLELLTAGRSFNLVALAALTAKLALIDNLLLQRAAGSIPGTFTRNHVNIRLPIVAELPQDYLGEFNADGTAGALSDKFSVDLYHYATVGDVVLFNDTWKFAWDPKTKSSNSLFHTRCEGTCEAVVQGFGFSVDCGEPIISPTYSITPTIVSKSTLAQKSNSTGYNATLLGLDPNFSRTILSVNSSALLLAKSYLPYSAAILNVTYARNIPSSGSIKDKTATTCDVHLVSRTCVLRPATLNYQVQITNITGSHAQDGIRISPNLAQNLTFLDILNDESRLQNGQVPGVTLSKNAYEPYDTIYDTNIQGASSMMQSMFGASVNLDYVNGTNGGYVPTASSGSQLGGWWEGAFAIRPSRKSCMIDVVDPVPWLVSQINSIMLRASIAAAVDQESDSPTYMQVNNTLVQDNIDSEETIDTIIYQSHYEYMIGALATMAFCVLSVLPSYWGFWELGRKVTLGPIEIASALGAPVLQQPHTQGDVNILLKEVGGREVRYGETQDGRLGLADANSVRHMSGYSSNRSSVRSSVARPEPPRLGSSHSNMPATSLRHMV